MTRYSMELEFSWYGATVSIGLASNYQMVSMDDGLKAVCAALISFVQNNVEFHQTYGPT